MSVFRSVAVAATAAILSVVLAVPAGAAPVAAGQAPVPEAKKAGGWTPKNGVIFSDPTVAKRKRVIHNQVLRSIRSTHRSGSIRIAVWNFDNRQLASALIAARRRGVTVQMVVAGSVENPNFSYLRKQLNKNRKDDSWARKCTGGCRSSAKVMHSKFLLFSRIRGARNVSMFGSLNLTTAAIQRQWNDLVTTRDAKLYTKLGKVFGEYARDIRKKNPYQVTDLGKYRVTLFPARNRNPVAAELRKVTCKGIPRRNGNGNGRTVIRIAIAGWYDSYGDQIAKQVRRLYNGGCDVKIVTTQSGRGINAKLRSTAGRGPIATRSLAPDTNRDGVPERYLHMKYLAINGGYNGSKTANVVFTGSPNWSTRAQTSDEIWIRMKGLSRRYIRHVNRLYASPSAGYAFSSNFGRNDADGRSQTPTPMPDWFELN